MVTHYQTESGTFGCPHAKNYNSSKNILKVDCKLCVERIFKLRAAGIRSDTLGRQHGRR